MKKDRGDVSGDDDSLYPDSKQTARLVPLVNLTVKVTDNKARETRVNECGWASEQQRPYRALGTPDLERAKPYRYSDGKQDAKHNMQTREGKRSSVNNTESVSELMARQKKLASGVADNGYGVLKRALNSSHRRLTGCKSGQNFTDHLGIGPLDIAPPGKAVPKLNLNGMNGRETTQSRESTATDGGARGPQSARFSSNGSEHNASIRGSFTHRDEKPNGSFLPSIKDATKVPKAGGGGGEPGREGAEMSDEDMERLWNSFDPAFAMEHSVEEFNNAQRKLYRDLTSNLESMSLNRKDNYRRKFIAFTTDATKFSSAKWQSDARKHFDAACRKAIIEHPWFSLFEAVAVDGKKGGKPMTEPEQFIFNTVKEVVENQEEPDINVFIKIFKGLKREDLEAGQVPKLIIFLRETLGISVEDMKKVLSSLNLPVPFSLTKQSNNAPPGGGGAPTGPRTTQFVRRESEVGHAMMNAGHINGMVPQPPDRMGRRSLGRGPGVSELPNTAFASQDAFSGIESTAAARMA